MKGWLLTLLLLHGIFRCIAQQERIVVWFMDENTGKPLQEVQITGADGAITGRSDSAGYASVLLRSFGAKGYLLAISTGYEPDTLWPGNSQVYMRPLSVTLKESVIGSKRTRKLLEDPELYIADYDFSGNQLLVAGYKGNNGKKAQLLLINDGGQTLGSCSIPEEPEAVFRSCGGTYYCACDRHFFTIDASKTVPELHTAYDNRLLPGLRECACAICGNHYYRITDRSRFTTTYGMIAGSDSLFRPFRQMENAHAATESQAEYIEILDLISQNRRSEAVRKQHARLWWDKAANTAIGMPLFDVNDTLLVFDLAGREIEKFDLNGIPVAYVPVRFTWKPTLLFEILQDAETSRLYVHRYDNAASHTIEELDIHSGSISGNKVRIEKPFPEAVKIHDGSIYFLWQDGQNSGTRQLYVQKMK